MRRSPPLLVLALGLSASGAAVAASSWMFFVGDGAGEGSLGLHWDLTQSGLCGQINGLQYSAGGVWYTLQASVGSASMFGDPYAGCVLSAADGAPVPPGLGGAFLPAAWLSDLPAGAFGLMGFQECYYAGGGTACRDDWLIPQFGPLREPLAWRSGAGGAATSGDYQLNCSGTCTVTLSVKTTSTLVVEPVPFTEEKAVALVGVFAALLVAGAVIWGAKALLNLFRTGRYET